MRVAAAVELGVAYLSLAVEASKIPGQVRRALDGVPGEGRKAGAELGRQMSAAAAQAGNFDKLKQAASAAQLTQARATQQLTGAQSKQRATASQLAIAEQRLTEVRGRGNATTSQIMAAEERVTKARAADQAAQKGLVGAYQTLDAAKGKAVQATGRLATEQTRAAAASGALGQSHTKAAGAANKFGAAQQSAVAATSRLGGAQSAAASSVNQFGAAQQRAVSSMSALGSGQTRAAQAADALSGAQTKAANSGSTLAGAQHRVAQVFTTDAAVKAKGVDATNAFANANARVPGSLSTVGGALSRLGLELGGVSRQAGLGREALVDLAGPRVVGALGRVSEMVKTGLAFGVTAGVGSAITSAVKLEATFSQTMSMVASATGAPAGKLKELSDLAVQLGADTSFSAGEAAEAMLELAKSGLDPATIQSGALSATLQQAAASGDSLGESAGAIGNALNMFSLKGSQAAEVAAAFAGGANASSAEVRDLTQGLAQVGPGAAAAGMSIQETVGILSAFNNAGMKGSDAGTSLKNMLTSLVPASQPAAGAMQALGLYAEDAGKSIDFLAANGIKVKNNSQSIGNGFAELAQRIAGAGASTEELSKVYADLRQQAGGVTNAFFDANGKMKSATEIAQILQDATKNLSDEERTFALNKIFGADASRAANILAKEGAAGLAKYIDATKNAGAAQDMANARMSGTAGALERLSGSWETFRLQAGQAFAPFIQAAADALGGSLEVIAKSLKLIVPLVTTVGIAWGSYVGYVKAATIATQAMELWTKRAAIAQALMGKALLLNPIGVTVAALALLAAGLVLAWRNSETFRNVVTGAWNAVKGAVSAAWGVIKPVLSGMGDYIGKTIVPALTELGSSVSTQFGKIRGWFADFGRSVQSALAPVAPALAVVGRAIGAVAATIGGTIGSNLVNTLKVAVSGVVDIFKGLVDSVAGWIRVLAAVIRGDWGAAWNGMKEIARGALTALIGVVKIALSPLIGVVKTVADQVAGTFGASWARLAQVAQVAWAAVSVIVSRMASAVSGTLAGAFRTINTVAAAAWAGVSGAVSTAWRSMSVVFTALRTWVASTLTVVFTTWRATAAAVWTAVTASITAAWAAILGRVFTPLRTWVASTLTSVFNAWRSLTAAVWNAVSSSISAAWNAILSRVFTPLRSWVTSTLPSAFSSWRSTVASVWSAITTAISNAWNSILSRVFTPLRTWTTSTLTSAMRTLQTIAASAWSAITSTIASAWTRISGSFTNLKNGVNQVWSFFQAAVKGISSTWSSLTGAIQGPINSTKKWINDNFSSRVNSLLGKVGVSLRLPGLATGGVWDGPGKVTKAASGAVLPGYTPGRDPHRFWSPTGGRLALSGGEAVMVPEWTRAVGPGLVRMMNRIARRGGVQAIKKFLWGDAKGKPSNAFASGGIYRPGRGFADGGVLDALRGIAGAAKDVFSSTKDKLEGVASSVGDAISDPVGAVKKLGSGLLNLIPGRDTFPGAAMFGAMTSAMSGIVGKVKEMFTFDLGGGGFGRSGNWPRAVMGRVSPNTAAAVNFVRSTFGIKSIGTLGSRPNKSDHPMGKALDAMIPGWSGGAGIALGNRVAQYFLSNPGRFGTKYIIWRKMINSGSGWRGYRHPTGASNPTLDHMDHVHVSFLNKGGVLGGGRAAGSVRPKLFDGGGMLERGDLALHVARRPDRVLTERQWSAVEKYLPVDADPQRQLGPARALDGGVHIHGDVYGDPERFARKYTTRLHDELALVSLAGV